MDLSYLSSIRGPTPLNWTTISFLRGLPWRQNCVDWAVIHSTIVDKGEGKSFLLHVTSSVSIPSYRKCLFAELFHCGKETYLDGPFVQNECKWQFETWYRTLVDNGNIAIPINIQRTYIINCCHTGSKSRNRQVTLRANEHPSICNWVERTQNL